MDLNLFFKKYSDKGRLKRAIEIPLSAIRYISATESKLIAIIKGSSDSVYTIYIKNGEVYHDCMDQRGYVCKHVIKALQSIDVKKAENIAEQIAIKIEKKGKYEHHEISRDIKEQIYKRIIQNLIQAGKYDEAFSYLILQEPKMIIKLMDEFPVIFRLKAYEYIDDANQKKYCKKFKKFIDEAIYMLNEDSEESFMVAQYLSDVASDCKITLSNLPKTLSAKYLEVNMGSYKISESMETKLKKRIEEAYRYYITGNLLDILLDFAKKIQLNVNVQKIKHVLNEIEMKGWKRKNEYLMYLADAANVKFEELITVSFYGRGLSQYPYYVPKQYVDKGAEKFILFHMNSIFFSTGYHISKNSFIHHYPLIKHICNSIDIHVKIHAKAESTWRGKKVKPQPLNNTTTYSLLVPTDKVLIEWDIDDPIGGEILRAKEGNNHIIPDPNSPLTKILNPFDITICEPDLNYVSENIYTIRPIRIVSPEQAIEGIYKGVKVISSAGPLKILELALNKEINVDALEKQYEIYRDVNFIPSAKPVIEILDTIVRQYAESERSRRFNDLLDVIKTNSKQVKKIWKEVFPLFDSIPTSVIPNLIKKSIEDTELAIMEYIEKNPAAFDKHVRTLEKTKFSKLIPSIVNFRIQELKNVKFKPQDDGTFKTNLGKSFYGKLILSQLGVKPKRSLPLSTLQYVKIQVLINQILQN